MIPLPLSWPARPCLMSILEAMVILAPTATQYAHKEACPPNEYYEHGEGMMPAVNHFWHRSVSLPSLVVDT
ncbi:hypothetical protein DFP72DRAFT_866604 [Ephemerocybe angulata]|uniref:Secreted protein n=1 Tax=Ephemerocybe angulata TaxID=980116 RepID=A0A8H6MF58_9AGAR|nr:hypothetical protein DFP72DRAFT_866604 [Tulosesus angulatus]